MLNLNIHHNGKNLSLELPLPIDTLAGELRAIGSTVPPEQIRREDVSLEPANQLGEHFMKLLRPDDTLHAIAISCREFDVLAGESRQALVELVMSNRFRDLDHMGDYLRHGPAAVDHFVRLQIGEQQIDLPAPAHELQSAGITQPNEISLRDLDLMPLNEQGKQLLIELSIYENLATANLACAMLTVPGITSSMREVAESARRLLPNEMKIEQQKPDCPLVGQDGNVFNLIGIAARTLRENGLSDQAKEMRMRAMDSKSYDQALGVIMEYVNVTSTYDEMEDDWHQESEFDENQDFGMEGMS